MKTEKVSMRLTTADWMPEPAAVEVYGFGDFVVR